MRSTYKLALIVLLAFAANVAISHVSAPPSIDSPVTVSMPVIMADSTVALWCAPAFHTVALAVAISAPVLTETQGIPVTDTGGSAVAGEPVAIQDITVVEKGLYMTFRYADIVYTAIRSHPHTINHPVTDLVA